jgi:hypothetical protein
MSGDPEQEYFADGMVEDIVTGLSRIKWLFVIARNSSFAYKGRAIDVKQVGLELGVRYVLEGSVRGSRCGRKESCSSKSRFQYCIHDAGRSACQTRAHRRSESSSGEASGSCSLVFGTADTSPD